jgi:hypothetical protein
MKTKLLAGLLLLLSFAACKKDKKPAPVIYSVVGTFTLASYQTNFGVGVNATVAQYPCIAYNIQTFYRDSTSSSGYDGIDSCFVTPTHLQSAGAQVFGLPGAIPLLGTWRQKGNNIYLTYQGNSQPLAGVVSNVNGRLQILFKDTVQSGGKTYYINSLEVQQ